MKLAVSNIAWPAELDDAAFGLLSREGIAGLEVAPTRVWPDWVGITPASIRAFRQKVESAGLAISSFQSILFQKPDLQLFGSAAQRQALSDHLCWCADLAADLSAGSLVFGSPKNRLKGELPQHEALQVAVDFFSGFAEYYAARKVCLVFEANPVEYGCDFATGSQTAAQLVRSVGSEGFGLHLDTACMCLAGEDPVRTIARETDILRHMHVSEPYLGIFANPVVPHDAVAQALAGADYHGWVALEMRAGAPPMAALEQAVRFFRSTYVPS